MNSALNRTTIALLTNKSGGDVAYGDVVILGTANAKAFTTTTTSGYSSSIIGVVIDPGGIANNASGVIATAGWVPKVSLNTAATLYDCIKTHTVAKQGTHHAAPPVTGDFGMALQASATPEAILWGFPIPATAAGNVATDAIWDAAGDLAVATGADAAAKLSIGTAFQVLRVNAGATAPEWAGGMSLISRTALSGTAADITFSSIPATYEDLVVHLMGRGDKAASTEVEVRMQLNADAGNNYDHNLFLSLGTSHNQYESIGAAYALVGSIPAVNGAANSIGQIEIRINSYARTTFHKSAIANCSHRLAYSTGNLRNMALTIDWRATSAVGTIKLFPDNGNFIAGTVASLYGIS